MTRPAAAPENVVNVPQNVDQAHGMIMLGMMFLKEFAPERLVQSSHSAMGNPVSARTILETELLERDAFEAQMRAEGVTNFARRPSGRYDNMVLEWHWLGWRGRARAGAPS